MCRVSVLIVDDEPLVRHAISRTVSQLRPNWRVQSGGAHWSHVEAVADPRAANEALERSPFGVILCDHHLEFAWGADYLREVAVRHPHIIRILTSGRPDAEQEGPTCSHAFFPKPPDSPRQLVELIERLLRPE